MKKRTQEPESPKKTEPSSDVEIVIENYNKMISCDLVVNFVLL